MFQPFYRVGQTNSDTVKKSVIAKDLGVKDGVSGNSSTGLGLSIVYQICQQAHIDIYLSPTQRMDDTHHEPSWFYRRQVCLSQAA